ncbi:MAG: hypothetical protein N4A53_08800 [Pelagimonas sp.]|jgi:hypothetical protein|nr:hypothetical protein [Pelagimonas sp.]
MEFPEMKMFKKHVKLLCCAATFMSCSVVAHADELKVTVFNAPASFFDTLKAVDSEGRIVLSSDTWFEPQFADAWAIFFATPRDHFSLPRLALEVFEEIGLSTSALVRTTAVLKERDPLIVQFVNLENSARGIQHVGCVTALDLAVLAYKKDRITEEDIRQHCLGD